MGLSYGGTHRAPRLNVTPLVDIVLVLLIVFIVLVPAVEVRLPAARHSAPADAGPSLRLTLQGDDLIQVEAASGPALRLPLRGGADWAGLGDLRGRAIQLRADASRPYRDLQAVLDGLRACGAEQVQFLTAQSVEGGHP